MIKSQDVNQNPEITLESNIHQAIPAYWSAVFAMTLCVFSLVASEFMPVSLLTPMAVTFQVTEGLIGQGIAISGALAVITSLSISILAGGIDRRTLLLLMTILMVFSGMLIAFAPTYTLYMIGRSLIGIAIGGFWSLFTATAIQLVPKEQQTRVKDIFRVALKPINGFGFIAVGLFFYGAILFIHLYSPFS